MTVRPPHVASALVSELWHVLAVAMHTPKTDALAIAPDPLGHTPPGHIIFGLVELSMHPAIPWAFRGPVASPSFNLDGMPRLRPTREPAWARHDATAPTSCAVPHVGWSRSGPT